MSAETVLKPRRRRAPMLPSNEVAMTKNKEIQTNVKINQKNECGEAAAATRERKPPCGEMIN